MGVVALSLTIGAADPGITPVEPGLGGVVEPRRSGRLVDGCTPD
jgi:hypothetical protein